MTLSSLRRSLAILLGCSLILISPGLAPYEALAGEIQGETGAPAAPAVPAMAVPGLPAASLDGAAPAAPSLPGSAEVPSAMPAAAAAAAPAAAAQAEVSADAKGVGEQLQALGDVSAASDGAARQTGESIQTVLSGRQLPIRDDMGTLPVAVQMAGMSGVATMDMGHYLAQPAGQESIGAPAQSFSNGPRVPTPPTPPSGPQGPQNEGPQPQPLFGRLASAAVALLPAALLGWPLIAAGSALAGALVVASSVGLAVVPFMSERSPALLRGLPGWSLGALGLATLYAGLTAAGWPTALMGAVVVAGGWGFHRFAVEQKQRSSTNDVLLTLLGGLGAVTGAGLVLLSPAGWYFTALTLASGVASVFLFAYLPGFVGAAMRAAADAFYYSAEDNVHVATSLSRDTTQRKRLEAWTNAHVKQSNWNALWLGLVWLAIGGFELAKGALGAVAGLVQGAFRAVPMMAWGAAHELAPQSGAARFTERWARAAFFAQKAGAFNEIETPLVRLANSDFLVVRAIAAGTISLAQIGWTISATVVAPFAVLLGWIKGFTDPIPSGKETDPRYFRLDSDPLPAKVPAVPEPAVGKVGAVAARVIAAGVAAVPLKLMGLALWGAGFEGMAAVIATLAVAAMPLMPAGDWMPGWARRLPGMLMTGTAGLTLYFGVRAALVGLPTGWILPLAGLTLLGGFGFSSMIDTLRDEKTKTWQVDRAEYIGGFGAALTLLSALGASMLGLTGVVPMALSIGAVLLSPLLLYHLGRPFWSGVWSALTAWMTPTEDVHKVMTFWNSYGGPAGQQAFGTNLRAWYRYWLDKSVWNGPIVLVPFLLDLAVRAAEGAISLAAGVVAWPFRAIPAFMLARAQSQNWDSPQTRFWRAFQQHLVGIAEGSKAAAFDPYVAKLVPAMGAKSEKTSRPALKAVAAFVASWFVQAYWLARLVVVLALTPLFLYGAYQAGAAARDAQPKK